MRSRRNCHYKITSIIILLLCVMYIPLPLQAKEASKPPHLIQTVSDQDIYEGLAALGFLKCETLTEQDASRAYEMVKECVVQVNMGKAYGSGLIWRFTSDAVIIATNAHVLAYWDDMAGGIYFPKGYFVNARVLGVSENYDVGFLAVDREQFGYEVLETLRHVSADEMVYGKLTAGDVMFSVGSDIALGTSEYHEGTVEDTWQYIEDFENYMLYGHGYARAGMSGGGVFDGYGHLIGMLTGGTQRNEIAAVPLPSLMEAWEEVMEKEGQDGTGK